MNGKRVLDVFIGVLLLLLAAIIVLKRLEFISIDFLPYFSAMQVLVGLVCAYWFFHSIFGRVSFTGMLFSLAIIGIAFNEELHLEKLEPWTLILVAGIGSIALNMIFGNSIKRHRRMMKESYKENRMHMGGGHHRNYVEPETIEGDIINEKVSFTGATKYIHSDNFKRADIDCSFGGTEVYLDKVVVPSGQAEIYVSANFSGVTLYIPREWRIVNNLSAFFGGVEIHGDNPDNASVTVTLSGNVSFSGVEVKRI